MRVILGDVKSMQERKVWEDAGWPHWLLKPVKLKRLSDILNLIGNEHKLDVSSPGESAKSREEKPTRKAKPVTSAPAAPATESDGPSTKVLIVDDNLVNQKLSAKFLQKLGCDVKVVDNGAKAVDQVKEQGFDIIFMDCQMPVMDGYEATKSIRDLGDASRSGIPVVAMTANAMAGDRERCLAAGMNDYITKPFKLADFKGMLSTWVEKSPPKS